MTTAAAGLRGQAAPWPLVGRESELGALRQRLFADNAVGVVLAGPAGVGKSRLGREGLLLAEQAGFAVAQVIGTSSASTLPFGAVAPLLPLDETPATGQFEAQPGVLRRCRTAILNLAAGGRLALLADDAHLLDPFSATLIHQIARSASAFLIVTIRTGASAPDSIVNLWKDGLADRLELRGLETESVDELLATVLGGLVDPAAVVELTERSQGNVLFLRELVLGALGDGTLRDDGGLWRLSGPLSPSDRLVELVETRLAGLSTSERELLEMLAFGEPLGMSEACGLAGPRVVERLERASLLTATRSGRRLELRMGHTLYGEVLRARVPAVRARDIARILAEAVERTGARRREDTLRIAAWRLEGGGGSPELLLAGAQIARARYDFSLATRLVRAALDAGAGFDAALLHAELTGLEGDGAASEDELAVLAQRARDDRQRSLVAVARFDNLYFMPQHEQARLVAAEAEAAVESRPWKEVLASRRLWATMTSQGPAAGVAAAEPLLSDLEGRALVEACMMAAYCYGRAGRIHEALDLADVGHGRGLTVEAPLVWQPWIHVFNRCEALLHAGGFAEAESLALARYREALDDHSPEAQACFALHLARAMIEQGRVSTAVRYGRAAVALYRELDRPFFVRGGLAYLALALAQGNRPRAAERALSMLDELDLEPTTYVEVEVAQARAWHAASLGDLAGARSILERGAQFGQTVGDAVGELAALHDLARLGRAREAWPRVEQAGGAVEGDLASARVLHVRALVDDEPGALRSVSRLFTTMGSRLLAAEAASDEAVAWRRRGSRSKAVTAGQNAALLTEECEGAVTPALLASDVRSSLTPAEQETAALAARGESNKAIAHRLGLSFRTVENRLHRVYQKTGLSSRTELALLWPPADDAR